MRRKKHTVIAGIVVFLLRPVVMAFRFAYRLADWLFDLDRRAARSNLNGLIRELERDYSFLFFPWGAHVLPEQSHGEPTMDFATVVLELPSIMLRATRDRGNIDWEVSLKSTESPWESLQLIVTRIRPEASMTLRHVLENHRAEMEWLLANPGERIWLQH